MHTYRTYASLALSPSCAHQGTAIQSVTLCTKLLSYKNSLSLIWPNDFNSIIFRNLLIRKTALTTNLQDLLLSLEPKLVLELQKEKSIKICPLYREEIDQSPLAFIELRTELISEYLVHMSVALLLG